MNDPVTAFANLLAALERAFSIHQSTHTAAKTFEPVNPDDTSIIAHVEAATQVINSGVTVLEGLGALMEQTRKPAPPAPPVAPVTTVEALPMAAPVALAPEPVYQPQTGYPAQPEQPALDPNALAQ